MRACSKGEVSLKGWCLVNAQGNTLEELATQLLTDTLKMVFAKEGVNIFLYPREGTVEITAGVPLGEWEGDCVYFYIPLETIVRDYVETYPEEKPVIKTMLEGIASKL